MGLWVFYLIYLTFSPFLVDVVHNHSHLIYNIINSNKYVGSLKTRDLQNVRSKIKTEMLKVLVMKFTRFLLDNNIYI